MWNGKLLICNANRIENIYHDNETEISFDITYIVDNGDYFRNTYSSFSLDTSFFYPSTLDMASTEIHPRLYIRFINHPSAPSEFFFICV